MSERKNAFSGKMTIKNKVSGRERDLEVTMPGIDSAAKLIGKKNRTARASVRLSFGRSVDYGDFSYNVSMGGECDVTDEDFFSGEAHQVIADHIAEGLFPFVEMIDESWLPEAYQLEGKIVLSMGDGES